MKLIDWNILKQNLKNIFTKPDQKSYLTKLLDNVEKQNSENKNLPFKIIAIREKGFIVKVCGLRGYISFAPLHLQGSHLFFQYMDALFRANMD